MKQLYVFFLNVVVTSLSYAQSVGIGTTTPATSAKLEISSTTQGFLPPRLTIAQRSAITNPALGLVIFCTDCDELQVYNGTIWKSMSGKAACISPSLPSVTICNQVWMQKNLDVSTYRNGDPIPQVTDATAWSNLTTGAWCYYNNGPANNAVYGKLYNWYAVNDARGLAPTGWHIPSDAEWTTLSTCLGGDVVAGGKMKEVGLTHWLSPNTGADNSSGFAGLPGGNREINGTFNFLGSNGYFWSSTELPTSYAWYRSLNYINGSLNRSNYNKVFGLSVRCLRD